MGSEFLWGVCAVSPLDLMAFEEAAEKHLRKKDPNWLFSAYIEFGMSEDLDEEFELEKVIGMLTQGAMHARNVLQQSADSGRPRVAEVELEGRKYYFTGLQSWGESSDELDAINYLSMLGLDSLGNKSSPLSLIQQLLTSAKQEQAEELHMYQESQSNDRLVRTSMCEGRVNTLKQLLDLLGGREGMILDEREESVPPVYSCDAKFKLLRSTENLWYQAGKEDALGVLGGEIARLNKRIEEYRAEGFYRESAELGGTKEMLLQLCQRIKDIPGVS